MKEYTYRCADCGKKTTARSPKAFLCRECAAKRKIETSRRHEEQKRLKRQLSPADEEIHTCDSPERIQMCLNCEKARCTNCFGQKSATPSPVIKKPTGAFYKEQKQKLVEHIKAGKTNKELAVLFDVHPMTIVKWVRWLKDEGLL